MHQLPAVGQTVQFYSTVVADRDPLNPGHGVDGMGIGPYAAIVTRERRNSNEVVTHVDLRVFPPGESAFDAEWITRTTTADEYFVFKEPLMPS